MDESGQTYFYGEDETPYIKDLERMVIAQQEAKIALFKRLTLESAPIPSGLADEMRGYHGD